MICTLVAAVLLSAQDIPPKTTENQPDISIGRTRVLPEKTYEYYDFVRQQEVKVTGRYYCEVQLRPFLSRDEPAKAITATMRPESPARSFVLKSVFTGVKGFSDEEGNKLPVPEQMTDFWFKDTPRELKEEVYTHLEAARQRSRTMYKDYKEKINPNNELRPNGWTERDYGHQLVDVYVSVHSYVLSQKPDGTEAKTILPTFLVEKAIWRIPQTWPLEERFTPDPVGDGGTGSVPADVPYMRLNERTVPLPVAPVGKDEIKDGKSYMDIFAPRPGTGFEDLWGGSGTFGGGTDMNKLNFPQGVPPGNWDAGPSFFLPPSTVWYPSSGSHQSMLTIGGGSQFGTMTMPGTFRTLCSNMRRKAPEEGVRYYPFRNPDPIAVAISKMPSMSRLISTGDQARNWIYTDQPTREEINKILIPGVSEGHYLNGLFDVNYLGGLEKKDVDKMLNPGLLDAASARPMSVQWALNELSSSKPKDVAKWLDSKPSDITDLFTQTDKAYGERGAFLFNELFGSPSGEIRRSALKLANSLGPNADPYLKGNLPELDTLQYSGNQAEEDMATDALGRWGK